jgi:exopolysaccharide biosynthesis protein
MSIYETALTCRFLGMQDAINLDGGGSSSLWHEVLGVLSHPSDNKAFDHKGERAIPNIIGIYK